MLPALVSSSGLSRDAAQFGQYVAGLDARRSALSKRKVELAIEREQFLAGGRLRGLGFDGQKAGTQLVLGGFDGGEGAGCHEGKDRRAEAGDIAFGHQDGLAHHVGIHLVEDGVLRSEEHTSELQSLRHLVCRLLLEKKKKKSKYNRGSLNDVSDRITSQIHRRS